MTNENIIFYDGECIFCSKFISYVVRKDKNKIFKLSHLQSDFAKKQSRKYKFDISTNFDSIFLLYDNKIYAKSNATLKILQQLSPFNYLIIFTIKLMPNFLRDMVYDFIGKRRHKLYCESNIPDDIINQIKQRLIDSD